MFAAAIIVLREVLEAALVIGIVLAAASGVPGSRRYVALGVAAGVLGSLAVAGLADMLAMAAEGMGQELFNATVLLLAVAMLGWHNVWMSRHAAQLSQQMRTMGQAVSAGTRPLAVLALVVALAVLREGSEVVLFLYGVAAGGTGVGSLYAGAALGLVAGATAGTVVYLGLLRVPLKHLFSVTALLVLLLAAGMASQAAGFLVQAGWLPGIVEPAWDSSALLPEHALIGQVLHTLTGYQERPSAMQLIFFGATFVTILSLMRLTRRPARPSRATVAALMLLATAGLAATPLPARAAHKVYSPIVEPGEVAVEVRGHHDFDASDARDGAQQWKAEIEWAPAQRWLTEALVEWEREPAGNLTATEVAWENVFQLTEQGQYWADVGLLAEYAHSLEHGGDDKLELGLLAEKAADRHVATANLLFERELVDGGDTEVEYAFQYRYRHSAAFEPGLELHGELGEIGEFGSVAAHRHQLGPAAFGKLRTSQSAIRYEVALLFGITTEAPDATLRVQLEYEF